MMARMKNHWHWFAGGGAILLFGILLIFRLGIPEKLLSGAGETVTPIQANVPVGETWMNITPGRPEDRLCAADLRQDGRRISLFRKYLHADQYDGDCPALDGPDGGGAETRPDALRAFNSISGRTFSSSRPGESVAGKKLTVRIGGPGEEKISVIALAEPPYLGGGILESVGAAGLKPGEGRTFPVFDPASLGQRPVRITLLGEEPLTIMGKSRQARKLSVDFMGMKQIAWVDPDGSVLREEGILGIALERVTRRGGAGGA